MNRFLEWLDSLVGRWLYGVVELQEEDGARSAWVRPPLCHVRFQVLTPGVERYLDQSG